MGDFNAGFGGSFYKGLIMGLIKTLVDVFDLGKVFVHILQGSVIGDKNFYRSLQE